MEGPHGKLTYTAEVADPDFERYASEMLKSIDGFIIGRKTYEMFVGYWPNAEGGDAGLLNSMPKYVASTTLESADWNNAKLIKSDLAGEIERLKSQDGRDLAVFGSSDLAASLIKRGLIDELRIFVTPYILGTGKRAFAENMDMTALRLARSETWSSGTTALFYERAN